MLIAKTNTMFRLSSENSSETVSKFYQFLTSSALVKDESDLVHTMKAWKGGGSSIAPLILTSALYGGDECSTSRPGHFMPRKEYEILL